MAKRKKWKHKRIVREGMAYFILYWCGCENNEQGIAFACSNGIGQTELSRLRARDKLKDRILALHKEFMAEAE